jgi:hypothetical protein
MLGFRRWISGEVRTGVDGGVTPVVRDGNGEVDDVLQGMANPEMGSARSFSSWNGAGWRLELHRAEVSSWWPGRR